MADAIDEMLETMAAKQFDLMNRKGSARDLREDLGDAFG